MKLKHLFFTTIVTVIFMTFITGLKAEAAEPGDTFTDEEGFITFTITSAGEDKTCAVTDFNDVIYDGEKYTYADRFIIPERVNYEGVDYTVTAIESEYRIISTEYVTEFEIPATVQSINTAYFNFDYIREESDAIKITLKCAPSAFQHLKMIGVNSPAIESIIYVPQKYIEEYRELLAGKTGCTFYDNDIEARTYTELPVAAIGDENVLPAGFYRSGTYYRILDPEKKTVSVITMVGNRSMGTSYEQPAKVNFRDNEYTVTKVEYYAYCDVFYDRFFELKLPSTITEIEPKSIGWTVTKLDLSETHIRTIPSNLINSGYDEYDEPTVLREIVLPKNCRKINNYAFYNCKKLKSITIPAGVRKIGYHALNKTCKKIYIEGELPMGTTKQYMKKTKVYVGSEIYEQALETLIRKISLGKCSVVEMTSGDEKNSGTEKEKEDSGKAAGDEEQENNVKASDNEEQNKNGNDSGDKETEKNENGKSSGDTVNIEYDDRFFTVTAPKYAELFGLTEDFVLSGYGEDTPELWYCWKTSDGLKKLELICDMEGRPWQMSFADYSSDSDDNTGDNDRDTGNSIDDDQSGDDGLAKNERSVEEKAIEEKRILAELKEKYYTKALEAAETIFPDARGKLHEADEGVSLDSEGNIKFYFTRVENDIDVPLNYVIIRINTKTGNPVWFTRMWDDNVEFPIPEKLIPVDDAIEQYEKALGIRPVYRRYSETVFDEQEYESVTNETIRIEYAPINTDVRIDAFTGEVFINSPESEPDSILRRVYDHILLESYAKKVSFGKLKKYITKYGLITADAAKAVVTENTRLNCNKGSDLLKADLYTSIGNMMYWKVEYTGSSTDEYMDENTGVGYTDSSSGTGYFDGSFGTGYKDGSVCAIIDAKTGRLIMYDGSGLQDDSHDNYTRSDCKRIAKLFLKEMSAETYRELKLDSTEKTEDSFRFIFKRQENWSEYADNTIGITVDAKSGRIIFFEFVKPEGLQMQGPGKSPEDSSSGVYSSGNSLSGDNMSPKAYSDVKLTPHEAFLRWMEQVELKLEYVLQRDQIPGKPGEYTAKGQLMYVPVYSE